MDIMYKPRASKCSRVLPELDRVNKKTKKKTSDILLGHTLNPMRSPWGPPPRSITSPASRNPIIRKTSEKQGISKEFKIKNSRRPYF